MLREKEEGMMTFSFDCQKNLVLPKVPDQSCYYSRQLYLYNFTIVQGSSKDPLNKSSTFAYIWTENKFAKGANQIASAIYHRLINTNFEGITKIRLMSDGCAGQNKNIMMIAMCSKFLLENQQIKRIEVIFPVTGHSFMPPDRVFGNIEKVIKEKEVIIEPEEYIKEIQNYATITKLANIPVLDWKSAANNIIKSPSQLHFKISQCKRFIIKRSKTQGNVVVRGELFYQSDLGEAKNICKSKKKMEMLQPSTIPINIPVKTIKLRDVKNLLGKHYGDKWDEISSLQFYRELLVLEPHLTQESEECDNMESADLLCEAVEEISDLRI